MVWEASDNDAKFAELSTIPELSATGYLKFDVSNLSDQLKVTAHPAVLKGLIVDTRPVDQRPTIAAAGKPAKGAKPPAKGAPAAPEVPAEQQIPIAELNVRGWSLDNATAHILSVAIPACPTLHTVRLFHVAVSVEALGKLAAALAKSTVNALYLDGCDMSVQHVEALKSVFASPQLKILSLRQSNLTDEAAVKVIENLKSGSLAYLSLWGNRLTDAIATLLSDAIAASKSLQAVSVGRTLLTDAAVRQLAGSIGRREVEASAVAAARKQLEEAKRKKGAELPPFEEDGGVLYRAGNRTLQRLDISYCALTDEVVQALYDAVKINTTITGINLDGIALDRAAQPLVLLQETLATRILSQS
eukprot:TRINITY_DN15681_c0_g1_i1.p1 TRINITY_DN15681_c0_g1~~TRINITY_DN15681_c0_g1_i1.p1  ORF type:complete len:360 (-),score=86.52 TRINITY_DN15681_c0_g1_i1:25-1104(-)